jgi:hypothetical protein
VGTGPIHQQEGSVSTDSHSLPLAEFQQFITDIGVFTSLGRRVILPPDAPMLSHVFWKYFRKFLNPQAVKYLHCVILTFTLFLTKPLQALISIELGVLTLIYVFKNF